MLPSSTVENYLKAIYLGETQLPDDQRLLPMGHLASALGVAPGWSITSRTTAYGCLPQAKNSRRWSSGVTG